MSNNNNKFNYKKHKPHLPNLDELKDIKYWIFDIDDTLYPKSSGLHKQIQDSMINYLTNYFKIPWSEASQLCITYYKKFGTTITGLINTTDINPRKFVNETHRYLDLSCINPNPRMADALLQINAKKYVFTNGSFGHGLRVSKRLGIEKQIDGFFGTQSANFIPKPDPRAFEEFFTRYNINPEEAIFFDDSKKNHETISKMGTKTVWVTEDELLSEDRPDYVDYQTSDITTWLEHFASLRLKETA